MGTGIGLGIRFGEGHIGCHEAEMIRSHMQRDHLSSGWAPSDTSGGD